MARFLPALKGPLIHDHPPMHSQLLVENKNNLVNERKKQQLGQFLRK